MTQEAKPENILGDFDDATVTLHGFTCRLFREDDKFLMDVVNPIWENSVLADGGQPSNYANPVRTIFEVQRLVGSHNMQVYLGRMSNGAYVTLPLVWLPAENRWISITGSFLEPEAPGLTTSYKVWNRSCVFCHNTKPHPGAIVDRNYQVEGWDTTLEEMGIACEACHGPGDRHIEANRNPVRRYYLVESDGSDSTIVNPARLPKEVSVEVCGRCHGKWTAKPEFYPEWLSAGDFFFPGGQPLQDRYHRPFIQDTKEWNDRKGNYYWRDGTPRPTGMEYDGIVMSPCYERGQLTCLSCHSMHDAQPADQLTYPHEQSDALSESNRACVQCHEQYASAAALTDHTHHRADSEASRCFNCHMPYQSYGLLKAVRSHRIASPNAAISAASGLSNACNQCHVDRSLRWTAENLARWYGHEVPTLSQDQESLSATLVDLSKGDAVARALAAASLGWSPAREASAGNWAVPFLAYSLDDSYPAVRLLAYQSLRKLDGFEDVEYDYLGAADVRSRQIEQVRRRWETQPRTAVQHSDDVPLGRDAQPVPGIVERLLKSQDQSEIHLAE